jgi:hypothetical protein
MQLGREGLSSANKVSTPNNRIGETKSNNNPVMPPIYSMSKAELMRAYQLLWMDKDKIEAISNQRLDEQIRLREVIKEANKETILYQKKYQELLDRENEDQQSECLHVSFRKTAG